MDLGRIAAGSHEFDSRKRIAGLTGYLFAILGMLSIGSLGILSKLADRRGCPALSTTLVLFAGSTALMGGYVGLFKQARFNPPASVAGMALIFGVLAVLAFWVFLYGLRFGKITTSWVFMNLSAAVPAVLSAVIYREGIGIRKLIVLSLVVVSILLLWRDVEEGKPKTGHDS